MKKYFKKSVLAIILTICFVMAAAFCAPTASAASQQSTYDEVIAAFQETAYAYFMRGKDIQYNSAKKMGLYSPEEATVQNRNYLVCSGFTHNVYYELMNVETPNDTAVLLKYAKANKTSPEVIGYGELQKGKGFKVSFYDDKRGDIMNPTVNDIIPHLMPGDIITYTGHTMVVYDLVKDGAGNVVDAYVMESMHGNDNSNSVNSKISSNMPSGIERFGSGNYRLYQNGGTVNLRLITTESYWTNLTGKGVEQCSFLRFVGKDANGNAVLNYRAKLYGRGKKNYVREPISLNAKAKQRIKFSKLYVGKTVDAFNENHVQAGDKLTYTVTVTNNSGAAYNEDLTVTEKIPSYTTYKSNSSDIGVKAKVDKKKKTVTWNIGKLAAGQTVNLQYTVSVNKNKTGKTIKSTGKVDSIATSTVTNKITKTLSDKEKSKIEKSYEKLKGKYTGRKLINEIYKDALKKDIGLNKTKITSIVVNADKSSQAASSITLKKKTKLSGAVLNKYYNALAQRENASGMGSVLTYCLKHWYDYGESKRLADTVYEENFETGDILLYANSNDKFSSSEGGTMSPITYEDDEYAYIFIEGKGFVGVNLGADKKAGTKDDRNEFNHSYHVANGLKICSVETDDQEALEFINYQSLFGKDSYVILRPSLILKKQK